MMTHRAQQSSPHRIHQSGFSLIEVLVTLLVLSIGLLGVAALQVVSLQYSSTSLHRSIAVIQANDLVERLWANACDVPDATRRAQIETTWNTAHAASIPGRNAVLNFNTTTSDYQIDIRWSEERIGGGTQNFVFFTRFPDLPECASL